MKAVIFDMDGLIIDSEPLWRRAEQLVFATVGIHLSEDMCMKTIGLRVDEVVRYWHKKHPWKIKSIETVEEELLSTVIMMVNNEGQVLDGVYQVLDDLKSHGFKLGLASSSPISLIEVVLNKLDIKDFFSAISSAADEERGKPDPAVYLKTIKRLNVESNECFAFEDSIAGVQSAKAAGLKVVAIPAPQQYNDSRFDLADIKLNSLSQFSLDMIYQF